MNRRAKQSINHRILAYSLALVLTTAILGMTTSLLFALRMEYQNIDRNLMNSAQVLAQSPDVEAVLAGTEDPSVLTYYLDSTTTRVQDIDAIVVADTQGVIRYSPDPAYIGRMYPGLDSLAVLRGESAAVDTGAGVSGVEHRATAAVLDPAGELLGFVSVGIGVRSLHRTVLDTIGCFLLLSFFAVGAAMVLSRHLSISIKNDLMGYEPEAFRQLFHQREDILEALEEGILAIDQDAKILYMNPAALRMVNAKRLSDVEGRPLLEIYPASRLPRLLSTGKAEYNVPLRQMPATKAVVSDRAPIWEGGRIVGAVAIFRDRTEATAMAEELTGVRHLVEAMRAYTHEFINKLHIILGMIQLGRTQEAEQYILDISQVHHQSVGLVMNRIQDTAVAALLVGKASRAAELGIHMEVSSTSALSGDQRFVPSGVLVTILGNLIENATECLNRTSWKQKEIHVSIQEKEDSLLLCVDDTGPGIQPELLPHLFQPGVTTKGAGHGIGLARIKELVNLYDGDIRVESEPKSGTTFFLTFHLPQPDPQPDGPAEGAAGT